ncbi:hypothetical protein GCM10009123_07330 [Kangiella japonica]|uniref:DUF6249 domain-containing protein n=1 Tax=Kangiella japonica TaxID=647384 RepID=A0ABP3CFJ5_9GAMM
MFDIIAILIPIILAICIVLVIRIINDTSLRKRLAETQTEKSIVEKILDTQSEQRSRSLISWGVSILSIGISVTIVGLLDLNANDPLAYGIIFIACGLSLLVAYILTKQKTNT